MYKVLAPVAFVVNGEVKNYNTAGLVVDVPESAAKKLVADGKLEPVEKKADKPDPKADGSK